MKTKIFLSLIVIVSLIFVHNLNAQERVIHGTVTTLDSIPLIGATIKVKSTRQEVRTDSLGYFSVGCNETDKLKVLAHGFYNQNVKLTDKVKFVAINLKLKPGEKSRELAIGYGYVSDADNLNAISSLTKDDVDFSRYDNIYDLIRGRFSGVQVDNGEIIIRGGANTFQGSSAALVVIDGVTSNASDLRTIKPFNVKSINVIKDGSSAIYGSRGANGVLIIETKSGGDN